MNNPVDDHCDSFECEDPQFHHDMLTAMIMLHRAENGNKVSFESASKVSLALMREDEHLPLEELSLQEVSNT